MKAARKLKRGLAEISPLFAVKQTAQPKALNHKTPWSGAESEQEGFICASIKSFSAEHDISDRLTLARMAGSVFKKLYLMCFEPNLARYDDYRTPLQLPAWNQNNISSDIKVEEIDSHLHFGCLTTEGLHHILHSHEQRGRAETPKAVHSLESELGANSLVLIDLPEVAQFNEKKGSTTDVFQILDHIILVVESDIKQIKKAYEWLQFCVNENSSLLTSVMLVGDGAQNNWEVVYEQFHKLAAQFLTQDLGFLGWVEGDQYQLNSDWLRTEVDRSAHSAYKKILIQNMKVIA